MSQIVQSSLSSLPEAAGGEEYINARTLCRYGQDILDEFSQTASKIFHHTDISILRYVCDTDIYLEVF